jgi:hypothetical protein
MFTYYGEHSRQSQGMCPTFFAHTRRPVSAVRVAFRFGAEKADLQLDGHYFDGELSRSVAGCVYEVDGATGSCTTTRNEVIP